MTNSDIEVLQESGLHRRGPYVITGVSRSMFSVARHYGGCTAYGERYVYVAPDDELVRADVVRWIKKRKKEAERRQRSDPPVQGALL